MQLNRGDPAAVATYNKLVTDDATATNCTPPAPLPPPTYTPDTALGSSATVQVSCSFKIFTPIISSILGNSVTVSSSAVFPIRKGVIAGVPTGGPAPAIAGFTVNPTGGVAPQTITFTDTSSGTPISYAWDFDGDGVTDYSTDDNPPPWTYSVPGTYHPTLTVSNGVTPTMATKTIVITAPAGPVANFDLALSSPTAPSTVTFTNTSTGSPTTWVWKFGDGTTSTLQDPPTKVYAAGTWTVELTGGQCPRNPVDDQSPSRSWRRSRCAPCRTSRTWTRTSCHRSRRRWQTAGFSTTVIFNPSRPPEYKITKQSLRAPRNRAGTVITVFDQ